MMHFSSIFEQTNEEEDKKKEKRESCSRRKRATGLALMLLLLVSIYAEPVAAWPWDNIGKKVKNSVGSFIHNHAKEIAGAVGIITTAVCLGTTMGTGSAACVAMGVSAAGATYAAIQVATQSSSKSLPPSLTSQNNATTNDFTNDTDILPHVAKVLDESQQAAYKKIAELTAMLRSDLTKYDLAGSGSTGDLWVEVYAPQKIYGYSAFPVQVKLYTSKSNIPFAYVHLKQVVIYLKETNSTVPLWKRTWDYGSGSEGLNGESAVYSTILKVPDPFSGQIKQMLETGQVDKKLIEQIFNSTTKSWEIFVEVTAYREEWQSDPTHIDQSSCEAAGEKWDANTSTCYEFVRNVNIDYKVHTTSAYRHVTMSQDLGILDEGMYASLPVKFASTNLKSKWTLYQETFAGAISDFIILTYASPVHVMDSTADYMFYIGPNKGYFNPVNVNITDDFRFFTVRILNGGSWELADTIFGKLGNLSDSGVPPKKLIAHYNSGTDVLTYTTLGIAYFEIHRDDGITIPIWEVVWPKVSVQENTRVVFDDKQIQPIVYIVNKSKITEDDLKQLRADIQTLENGLEEKLNEANALKEQTKSVGNKQAEAYAEKAVLSYKQAIDDLKHASSSDNKQIILNYLNAAKKYEQAGDFYVNAAKKALYGAPEQAKLDAQMANTISNTAKQYEPHWNPLTALQKIDWKMALILVALTLVGYLALGRLGAMIGFILGLIVVFGPVVLDWLKNLKFW